MDVPLDCPAPECLRALLDETLPPGERADYERHLESCPTCQGRLDRAAEGGDALLRLVRQVGDPKAAAADPTLARVLRRLHDAPSPLRASSAKPPDLFFLEPSARPGVRGTLGKYEV